jgi:hypothetical protein
MGAVLGQWPFMVLALSLLVATNAEARTFGTPKAPEKGLDPLYRRIAADLQQGRPLVVTVHVALCDNGIIWCGGRGRGDGDAPRRNLYWGAAGGLRAFFDRARGYRRVYLDSGDEKVILERVVYRLRVRRPSSRWRRLGVRKAFEVLLVGLAYRGSRIAAASDTFIRQVATEGGGTLRLADGRSVAFGGQGHLVGYAGHNHLMDTLDYRWPEVRRRQPLGYFALSCRNGPYLAPKLCAAPPSGGHGPRALLLTLSLMYPGAFTIDGLIRGVAAAEPQHEVFLRGVAQYARFQKRPQRVIRAAFIHDGQRRYYRILKPGTGFPRSSD